MVLPPAEMPPALSAGFTLLQMHASTHAHTLHSSISCIRPAASLLGLAAAPTNRSGRTAPLLSWWRLLVRCSAAATLAPSWTCTLLPSFSNSSSSQPRAARCCRPARRRCLVPPLAAWAAWAAARPALASALAAWACWRLIPRWQQRCLRISSSTAAQGLTRLLLLLQPQVSALADSR